MAKVTVIATQDFAHGAINARVGDELVMDEGLARDLKRFVRVKDGEKMKPAPRNKMQPDSLEAASGKAPAAGKALSSSSLPVAPASRPRMSNKFDGGAKKGKGGGSLR